MLSSKISVIIPVHNRAQLLGQTLRALLNQTHQADEIIVVDDGSTDGSGDAARAYGSSVQVITTPNNGPARARNRGLALARGDYIQFMDSDDLPTPHFLQSRFTAISQSNADIAYGPWLPAWLEGQTLTCDGFVRQMAPTAEPLDAFLEGWVLFLPNALIRRALIDQAGGYPEDLVTGEDMLLLFRLLSLTNKLVHTDASILLVRQHPDAQISARPDLSIQRLKDELVLVERVSAAVHISQPNLRSPSMAAVQSWERRRVRAYARAVKAGVSIRPEISGRPLGLPRLAAMVWGLEARLKAKMRSVKLGHRLPEHFQAAPLGSQHIRELRLMGLEVSKCQNP